MNFEFHSLLVNGTAMNFDRLRYFETMARTGNLTRAAELLGLSAAALSKAMSLLQSETGLQLFKQVGRELVLTPSGDALLARISPLLQAIQSIPSDIQAGIEARPPLRIVTFEVFSTYFLDRIQFHKLAHSRVQLHESQPGELEQVLIEKKADYGITYIPVPRAEIEHIRVGRVVMGVYGAKNAFRNLAPTEVPFVVPIQPLYGAASRIQGLDGWPEDAYIRKVAYEVTLMESAIQLAEKGLAAVYLPEFIVELHNRRVRKELELQRLPSPYGTRRCTTDIYIARRKGDPEDRTLRELVRSVRTLSTPAGRPGTPPSRAHAVE